MKLKLRPYQDTAVNLVLDYATEHPTGRLMLVIPTRGGKTFVAAVLVRIMVIDHGLRALWLVHREELLDEAVAHLIESGIPAGSVGVIKAGRSSDPDAKVQIASDATLDRRQKPVAQLVITDEAHRDTAPRRRRLRKVYPNAFLLGITATPIPPAGRDLTEDYDVLTVVVQPSELIHDGYLAPPMVYAPAEDATPDLRGLRLVGGDYSAADLEPLLLRASLLDDQVREWARLAERRRTIAYPVTTDHSRALVDRFRAAGVAAMHLDGETATDERKRIIAGLRSGKIPVVCSPGVLSEGTNLPEVKCVLGVRPTRSLTLYIQQSMRCATPWQDVRPRVLDVVGNVYRFGYPHADRTWSLRGESGDIVGGNAPMKRCPRCGAIMQAAAMACSACTYAFPAYVPSVPENPLELREVALRKAEREHELARLVAFATERRFKSPGAWAEQVIAAKHGASP
jgi:superfamily II DNA or RNA helicase